MTAWFRCDNCIPVFSYRQKVIMSGLGKSQKISAMALFFTIWIFRILRREIPTDIKWCYFTEEAWEEVNK